MQGEILKKKEKKSALLSTAFSLLTREIIISCKPLLLLIRVYVTSVLAQGHIRAASNTFHLFLEVVFTTEIITVK